MANPNAKGREREYFVYAVKYTDSLEQPELIRVNIKTKDDFALKYNDYVNTKKAQSSDGSYETSVTDFIDYLNGQGYKATNPIPSIDFEITLP